MTGQAAAVRAAIRGRSSATSPAPAIRAEAGTSTGLTAPALTRGFDLVGCLPHGRPPPFCKRRQHRRSAEAAKRRLPRVVFDYIDGGAEAERTLRENCRAFDDVTFRPRCAVADAACDLRTTVLGTTLRLPFLLAPVGSSRACSIRAARRSAARAAGAAGTGYILSTLSGCLLEDVKAATTGPALVSALPGRRPRRRERGHRARTRGRLLRARRHHRHAGRRDARARPPQRHRSELLSGNPPTMLPYVPQLLARPRWLAGFLARRRPDEVSERRAAGTGPMPYADVGAALDAVGRDAGRISRWIREVWRRTDRRQGRPHRRRCAARRRRGR